MKNLLFTLKGKEGVDTLCQISVYFIDCMALSDEDRSKIIQVTTFRNIKWSVIKKKRIIYCFCKEVDGINETTHNWLGVCIQIMDHKIVLSDAVIELILYGITINSKDIIQMLEKALDTEYGVNVCVKEKALKDYQREGMINADFYSNFLINSYYTNSERNECIKNSVGEQVYVSSLFRMWYYMAYSLPTLLASTKKTLVRYYYSRLNNENFLVITVQDHFNIVEEDFLDFILDDLIYLIYIVGLKDNVKVKKED